MIVVGMKTCKKCKELCRVLDEKGIEYEYHNIKDAPLPVARRVLAKQRLQNGYIDFPVVLDAPEGWGV